MTRNRIATALITLGALLAVWALIYSTGGQG